MNRQVWKSVLLGTVIAIALLAAAQANASGGWWWGCAPYGCGGGGCGGYGCYEPCGYTACYTGCYSSCYTGCYSGCYSGCWGRHHCAARYASCGWGCGYGWSGCSTCCDSGYTTVASCCGDVNVNYSGTPSVVPAAPTGPTPAPKAETPAIEPKPVAPAPVMPMPPAIKPSAPAATPGGLPTDIPAIPSPASRTFSPSAENSGLLMVYVPYQATVTINGLATHSTGSKRQFVSYGLKPGFTYKYEVKAQIVRDGQVLEESQTISLTVGSHDALAFGFNTPKPTEEAANLQ